jgi:hypothetical protein
MIVGVVIAQTYHKENYAEREDYWGNGASEQNTKTHTEKENYRGEENYRKERKESWTENEETSDMEQYSNSEQYIEEYHKKAYNEENYWKAREDYWTARQEYMDSKSKYKSLENEVVFQNAKNYLNCGCLLVESWFGGLKIYIETSNLNKDEKEDIIRELETYIDSFEEYRNKILEAQTSEEIIEVTQEIKNVWLETRKEAESLVGKVACLKLNKVIQRAELVEMRLEGRIALLNQSGFNTTELEAILEEYSRNLDMANESLYSALQLYESEIWDDYGEAEMYIRNATNCIKTAFNNIKEFLMEFKSIQAYKPLYGNKTGEVWVYGNYGNVTIKGSGIANVRVNGTVNVTPASAVISVAGFVDRSAGINGNETANFEGDGESIIRGENITIEINGTNIRLFAKGNGSVLLEEAGVYRVKSPLEVNMTDEITFSNKTLIHMGMLVQ